ncbi:MAG: hypothetical protein RIB71_14000 [Imperialibacter sp.]|uniref:hypothetical protein n=1 Tax=Imperialibacter sp. TaxID=2038411 RepID=UPI0032ED12B5
MSQFDFKKRSLLSGPHLLGSLMILAGVFALISPMLMESGSSLEKTLVVGVGAVVIGLTIASSYSGTLIHFSENKIKHYTSILGYKFGGWVELPAIARVTVTSTKYRTTNTSNGISPTLSGEVTDYRVLLYTNNAKPAFSFAYPKRSIAIDAAKRLADGLYVDLVMRLPEE